MPDNLCAQVQSFSGYLKKHFQVFTSRDVPKGSAKHIQAWPRRSKGKTQFAADGFNARSVLSINPTEDTHKQNHTCADNKEDQTIPNIKNSKKTVPPMYKHPSANAPPHSESRDTQTPPPMPDTQSTATKPACPPEYNTRNDGDTHACAVNERAEKPLNVFAHVRAELGMEQL